MARLINENIALNSPFVFKTLISISTEVLFDKHKKKISSASLLTITQFFLVNHVPHFLHGLTPNTWQDFNMNILLFQDDQKCPTSGIPQASKHCKGRVKNYLRKIQVHYIY